MSNTFKYRVRALRRKVEDNPAVGYTAAAVPLVLAIVLIAWQLLVGEDIDAPFRVEYKWFYDLNTQETFVVDIGINPPIEAPSAQPAPDAPDEPAGVLAYVYGCGGCDDTFIGYLEKHTIEARDVLDHSEKHDSDALGAARQGGTFLRAVDGDTWHASTSAEAGQLKLEAVQRCGNQRLTPCYPR